jgi:cytochrome P450 family 4
LSQHPDVQQKAYDEIISILGSKGHNVALTHSNLQDMKYLEMAIKETLRLHPSVPVIGRNLTEDTEIGGVMVPKGIDIGIQIFAIHRNPEVFPNPGHFDPERFCEGYELRKNPYEYIPFSAGPRNCIGNAVTFNFHSRLFKIFTNFRFRSKIRYVRNESDIVETIVELQNTSR